MMKFHGFSLTKVSYVILLMCAMLPLSQAKAGIFDDKIDEAEKLIKLSGYERQAHELLQQAIIDDPTDAKTLYRAGEAYAKMGWSSEADRSFSNAYKIDRKYGKQISQKYYSSGRQALQNRQENQAVKLFNRALDFHPQPELKNQITTASFDYAIRSLNAGSFASANVIFVFMSKIDPSLSPEIGNKYYNIAVNYLKKMSTDISYNLLSSALQYNPSLSKQIELAIFEQGKELFANNQFEASEQIFAIGVKFNKSFSDMVTKLYTSILNLTPDDLDKMIRDYYANNGEWAGIFEIEYIEKLRIQHISLSQKYVHAKYRYRAIPGNKKGRTDSGFDQRIFVIKEDAGKYTVVSMLKHNSARF